MRQVTPGTLRRIKDLAAQRLESREIARHTGLSISTVHKARQGYYDDDRQAKPAGAPRRNKITWCQRCRCHCEGSCKVCETRRGAKRRPQRPRPPIPAGITDPGTIAKLELPLSLLGISVRTVNRLEACNVLTVNDLLHCTRTEVLAMRHVGDKALEEIYVALARCYAVSSGPSSSAGGGAP
jgi:hypothetical protein